ncbi:Tox-REase-5 domain-containing protein [Candidatus Schmidhempelia bombi]|uniref:Tox-REase-5 domain-containing protein n=1 Tax=Candidatus Schmidhempelia bombi TaxID=1505866 RepID=UPI00046622A7|nr:Tox-REase-5 domain-containing protein [Candidatus Schmidhempelia bombi]
MVLPLIVWGVAIGVEEVAMLLAGTGAMVYMLQHNRNTSGVFNIAENTLPNDSTINDSDYTGLDEVIELEHYRISTQEKQRLGEDALTKIKVLVEGQNCHCPPDAFKRVRLKECRRGMSLLALDYQSAITGLEWREEKGNKKSRIIPEWEYFQGPGNPPVTFDGWLPKLCLFLEAKARYDFLFEKGTAKPKLNVWAESSKRSLIDQAERHNTVCDSNRPAKCCWVWMTPKAYRYFQNELVDNFPHLLCIYVPLLD